MKIPYFDAHCDTIGMALGDKDSLRCNPYRIDLQRGKELGRYAQFFALYGDVESVPHVDLWTHCRMLHRRFEKEIRENSDLVRHCRSGAEVDGAVEQGLMAALLSIESADLLECRIDRIETVAQWGVRMMNLTWNHPNAISGANRRECERGLSQVGRDFVREMEANGIYADVSHRFLGLGAPCPPAHRGVSFQCSGTVTSFPQFDGRYVLRHPRQRRCGGDQLLPRFCGWKR